MTCNVFAHSPASSHLKPNIHQQWSCTCVCVCSYAYVVSKVEVEFLQDQQVSAEQRPGHGHVTDSLANHRHCGAAAIQLRQADPHVQGLTCKTQHRENSSTGTGFYSDFNLGIFLLGAMGPSPQTSESVSRSNSLSMTIMAASGLRTSCSLFCMSTITLSLQEKGRISCP